MNRPWTYEEVQKLLNACGRSISGRRNACFIALIFGGGLRSAEALSVLPRDLEKSEAGTTVKVEKGKGGKKRIAAILPEFVPVIDAWMLTREKIGMRGHVPLVCGITKSNKPNVLGGVRATFGKRVSTSSMRATIYRLSKRSKITKRIHCHGARSGHATHLIKCGASLRVIQGQLGHTNLSITDRYIESVSPVERILSVTSFGIKSQIDDTVIPS